MTLEIDPSWTPQQLEEEMCKVTIPLTESSTLVYYLKKVNKSYKIKLNSVIRGSAIAYVMTKRRPGWHNEAFNFYKMCKAVKIEPEFVWDPSMEQIKTSMLKFATSRQNINCNLCFVGFMGHGYSRNKGSLDMYFDTGERNCECNIWAVCQDIFGRKASLFKDKPKIVFCQTCRIIPDGIRPNSHNSDEDMHSIRSPDFNHYLFVAATQPDEYADRNILIEASYFLLTNNAHNKKVETIFTTLLLKHYRKKGLVDSPQAIMQLQDKVNLFPGITESLLVGVSFSVNDSFPDNERDFGDAGMKKCPKQDEPKGRNAGSNVPSSSTSGSAGLSSGQPVMTNHNFQAGLRSIEDESNLLVHEKERIMDEQSRKEYKLVLNIRGTIPDNQKTKEDAHENMFTHLSERKTQFEAKLTIDLEAEVNITDITKISNDSIVISIRMDEEALKRLTFLSDSGLLTYEFQTCLVTGEYLEQCTASSVKVQCFLDSTCVTELPPVIEDLTIKYAYIGASVKIKCPAKVKLSGNKIVWSKDDEVLENTQCQRNETEDGRPLLLIPQTDESNAGRYKCEYTGMDNRTHIAECPVLILGGESRRLQRKETELDSSVDTAEQETEKTFKELTLAAEPRYATELPPVIEDRTIKYAYIGDSVKIKCPDKVKCSENEITWYKDDEVLENAQCQRRVDEDGRPLLLIPQIDESNAGRYKCEYTGIDNRAHIAECPVLILTGESREEQRKETELDSAESTTQQDTDADIQDLKHSINSRYVCLTFNF